VEAIRRWNARRTSPSFRAIRLAGPPIAWLVVAGVAGVAGVVPLYLLGVHDPTTLIAVPPVAFAIACLADRDGWRIRLATAELAALQRQRWSRGRLPADPVSTAAWLAANPDAPVLDRAGVLVTAGRFTEARELAMSAVGSTPEEIVRLERLRLTIRGALGEASLDRPTVEAFDLVPELASLSGADRRFHRLSLAWSAAWLQIRADRPWRATFADVLRDLGPFRPPLRYAVFHAVQQLALPIAYLLAWLIVTWLGFTDWIR
jgi:hypothetical protein